MLKKIVFCVSPSEEIKSSMSEKKEKKTAPGS